jgi:hypothetical protein
MVMGVKDKWLSITDLSKLKPENNAGRIKGDARRNI